MLTFKLLINSVVSTQGAAFMTMDISDFYLGTDLPVKQYMYIRRDQMSQRTITELNLADPNLWRHDKLLVRISKGIYGLPEAGKLAQDKLYSHLSIHGYHLVSGQPGLLKHDTRPILFSLVVDDFGVKYVNRADVIHLMDALKLLYKMTVDWSGEKYLGFTIAHDKVNHTIDLSMPGYIHKLLARLKIPLDGPIVRSPAPYVFVPNGKRAAEVENCISPPLDPARVKTIEIASSLLYYSRGIDCTMLCDVNRLSSIQSEHTEETEAHATHPPVRSDIPRGCCNVSSIRYDPPHYHRCIVLD
jgi:hypothetical protein